MTQGVVAGPSPHHCKNHPEREGIGICVRCRHVVCVECATKIDRMNYCISCLSALSADPAKRRKRPAEGTAGAAQGIALLVLSYLVLLGLFLVFGLVLATWKSRTAAAGPTAGLPARVGHHL